MVSRLRGVVGRLWCMVGWLWCMVGWLRGMVSWLWCMVSWLWGMVGGLWCVIGGFRSMICRLHFWKNIFLFRFWCMISWFRRMIGGFRGVIGGLGSSILGCNTKYFLQRGSMLRLGVAGYWMVIVRLRYIHRHRIMALRVMVQHVRHVRVFALVVQRHLNAEDMLKTEGMSFHFSVWRYIVTSRMAIVWGVRFAWSMIGGLRGMVSRFWGMISWFWGVICRLWGMISRFWGVIGWLWSVVSWLRFVVS